MKSFLKNNFPLIAIIALAVGLRLIKLGSNPIGFNDDEAAFGYNAYTLLTTGRDEWGKLLPFPVFESFGDWKLVMYLYLTAISQFIFGVSEFATRLPSAIMGILSVAATYLLGTKLFEKKVGLMAAFLLAISPWHIVASRNAFESDILIFFITIGTYFFLQGFSSRKYFILAVLSFAASFYVYRSSWLFVPLFVASLTYFYRDELRKVSLNFKKYIVLAVVLLAPLLPVVLTFQGQSRFFQESFIYGVSRIGILNEINEKRGVCRFSLPSVVCSAIYNKYSTFTANYTNIYFENLSPGTYFTKGMANGYQSFSNRGLFYSFELVLLISGIAGLLLTKNPNAKILFAWILLSPIGASFTSIGNPGRLNIIMPSVQLIEAFGFFYLALLLKKLISVRVFYAAASLVVVFSLTKLITDMFLFYPQISGRYQRYGYKQLFEYISQNQANYTEVAVSRKTDDSKQYIHYLFFSKYDPKKYLSGTQTKSHRDENGWQVVEKIGNVNFYQSTPPFEDLPPKSLMAVGEHETSFVTKPIFTVDYPNGDRFFEIYDVDEVTNKKQQLQ